jgi:hypothetical protein
MSAAGLYVIQPHKHGGWGAKPEEASRFSRTFTKKAQAFRWAKKRSRVLRVVGKDGTVAECLRGDVFTQRDGSAPSRLLADCRSFKVRPANRNRAVVPDLRFYWIVRIFETREAMHAYGEWRSIETHVADYEGKVIPRQRVKIRRGLPSYHCSKLGKCILWRGKLQTGVVVHECFHMATATMRAMKQQRNSREPLLSLDNIDSSEEDLAYTLTSLTRQVVDALHEGGYYKNGHEVQ